MHPNPTSKAFQELALNYEFTVNQELLKSWGVSYTDFIEQILQFAGIRDRDWILDIATGTGLIPRTVFSMPGWAGLIIGLDITFSALQFAKAKIGSSGNRTAIPLTCATALALPFASNSFDFVICALASHHIPQHQLIGQVSSVLKPGGQFILADVIASPCWRFPGVKLGLRLAAFVYFLFTVSPARAWIESMAVSQVYTEKEWMTALEKHHFSSIRVGQSSIKRTWAPAAILIAATKSAAQNGTD
jgi:ubiquinone/menaquinone biosynthesis C-methylase UbiE